MSKAFKIMGIVNVTPNSLYARYPNKYKAVAHALTLIQEGADIIDIGGESTRPFAEPVSIEQECDRVIPVIEILAKETSIPISIDTRNTAVMKAALEAGASIINDVTSMEDEAARALVASYQVPVCMYHMKGEPTTMQVAPSYHDVVTDVMAFLQHRLSLCEKAGILRKNIWIDPGIGFGKSLEHNLTLIGQLSEFKQLGCQILIGLSRKSMFGKILNKPEEERLYGSIAGAVISAMNGATIIRTHDVSATKDALAVVEALQPYLQRREMADVSTA